MKKSTEPVRVAVNIRPLTSSEGCTDRISVTPDEPQVHIGSHTFMYDFVFGKAGLPFSQIYHRCVAPLVEDLFKGYNASILAYGQTASGKSYTMGTNCGASGGIIPKVMEDVFTRVEAVESQIQISFLEIYNEEIYDLLASRPSRAPIRIRETDSGEITLQGVTEVEVKTKEEMSSYLARGSSTRATGNTNMNKQSSRSHAIFTISVKITTAEEEILCAKLRLVDLAGSERANRTGADGIRLKEGRHINSSLLALGNVIKILGDERKRKKGGHIPYRVSKLTRLLQDSLGGNSKTVMIACVSPADSDVEETLNTLRYANYARNIKNKAVVQKQKPSAPSSDHDAIMVKELTPSHSDAKNKTVVQKQQPSAPSSDYADDMFKELTPLKSESLPVYDKEDVFPAFSELKISWTSQTDRFDDLFASTSSPSELRKPVYDKPVYDEDVFEAISELHYNEDVFEANHKIQNKEDVFEATCELQTPSTSKPFGVSSSPPSELRKPVYDKPDDEDVFDHENQYNDDVFEANHKNQYNDDVFEANHEIQYNDDAFDAISELQIPSTSQQDDVSSSPPSELRKNISPEKTESEQKDKCQTKPVEIIDLPDDDAEVQEKCFIDLTTNEEAEVKEKTFIDLTTAESKEKLGGLRKKLASRSSATPSCKCSKRSSCKTIRCQCVVANHFCVPSCGCSSSRCSNRSREERLL